MADTMKPGKQVYQFKITLKDTKPIKIWRLIQVPEDFNFYELSHAILNAMGWHGGHKHDFKMKNPQTGAQETIGEAPDEVNSCSSLDEKETKMKDFFINRKSKAFYEYDFVDGWIHIVQLHKILPSLPNNEYPIRCIAGKGACPPEGCGGPESYKELLKKHEKAENERSSADNKELELYHVDGDFDSEKFDPREVSFDIFEVEDSFPTRVKKSIGAKLDPS